MQDTPTVLLLDDGELSPVAQLLDQSRLRYRRLRGADIGEEIAPPLSLLISTPRHAGKVRRGSPPGALAGRPVRIIAVQEDSPSLRHLLRTMGFHLLIRQPAHSEVWRLLIQRALYQGEERRRDARLPIGSQISVASAAVDAEATAVPRTSLLVDISNRGCHFVGDRPFEVGARVAFELEATATGGEPLLLSGEIVRSSPRETDDTTLYGCGVMFADDLDESSRMTLARLINSKTSGPRSLAPRCDQALSLPVCDSSTLPGLPLDDETDPAVSTEFEVALGVTAVPLTESAGAERRKNRRADYLQRIEVQRSGGQPLAVQHDDETSVLMGRDLSSGGMRVERFTPVEIGAHLDLALYGPNESEPLMVDAEVIRDDGEQGIALRFCNLPAEDSVRLESFVACLPAVESLEDGEALGMGSVLAEVLPSETTGTDRFNR